MNDKLGVAAGEYCGTVAAALCMVALRLAFRLANRRVFPLYAPAGVETCPGQILA
jgi:hypothetical protein